VTKPSRPRRTSVTPLVILIGLTVPATLGPAGGAAASPGPARGAFSVRPATSDPNDLRTRAYFRPVLGPGASLTEDVVVTDTTDAPVHLFVYPVDGLTGATSGTVYADRADPRLRAALWLNAAVPSISLAPHSEQDVAFTIRVPPDATPGDHVAGIAFEDEDPTHLAGSAVTEIVREVLGVQVRVPGPGTFHLHIDGASFVGPPAASATSVVIRLGDDGSLLGQPRLLVTLTGPDGYSRTVDRQLDTLLPGDVIDYALPWPDPLTPGSFTISVVGSAPGSPPAGFSGTGLLAPSGPTPTPGAPAPSSPGPGAAGPLPRSPSRSSGPGLHLRAIVTTALVAVALALSAALVALEVRRRRGGRLEATSVLGTPSPT